MDVFYWILFRIDNIFYFAIDVCSLDKKISTYFKEYFSFWIAGILIIFLVGTGATYGIGYGLGGTSFGQASLNVYDAFTGAERELESAINNFVDESC